MVSSVRPAAGKPSREFHKRGKVNERRNVNEGSEMGRTDGIENESLREPENELRFKRVSDPSIHHPGVTKTISQSIFIHAQTAQHSRLPRTYIRARRAESPHAKVRASIDRRAQEVKIRDEGYGERYEHPGMRINRLFSAYSRVDRKVLSLTEARTQQPSTRKQRYGVWTYPIDFRMVVPCVQA